MEHALPPALAQENHESDTNSDADQIDHLTCEYQDNPFASFIKQLELLTKTDPQEALRVLKLAITDRIFNQKAQMETLSEKLDNVIELVQEEREKDLVITINDQPAFAKDFFKSVWAMPRSIEKPANGSKPAPAYSPCMALGVTQK